MLSCLLVVLENSLKLSHHVYAKYCSSVFPFTSLEFELVVVDIPINDIYKLVSIV